MRRGDKHFYELSMERLFLIGGSGFIGKNFVDVFDKQYEIYVFDRYIDEEFFSHYNAQTCRIDLVSDAIPDGYPTPDYIVNLSSIVNTSDDLTLFDQLISSNLKVLLNLYEQFKTCETLKLFVQFGSSEEYGAISTPFKEETREQPSTPYALVKQLVVNTSMMLYRNFKFPIMAVRPGNLFGKYQNTKRFIPYIITQLSKNEPLDVSKCEQKRDFMYINDFVSCLNKLLDNHEKVKGEIVNISTGKSVSLKSLIEICRKATGSVSVVNYGVIPYKANEIMDLNCSVNKYENMIGENVPGNLQKAIHECVNFYAMGGGKNLIYKPFYYLYAA